LGLVVAARFAIRATAEGVEVDADQIPIVVEYGCSVDSGG
jgi:hypothetical protein